MVTEMVQLGLQKGLFEDESLEICFELRHSGEISQTGRQRIPDRWSDELNERSPEDFKLHHLTVRALNHLHTSESRTHDQNYVRQRLGVHNSVNYITTTTNFKTNTATFPTALAVLQSVGKWSVLPHSRRLVY